MTYTGPVLWSIGLSWLALPMFQLALQGPDAGHSLVELASQVPDSMVNPASCALKWQIILKNTTCSFIWTDVCFCRSRISSCNTLCQYLKLLADTAPGQSPSIHNQFILMVCLTGVLNLFFTQSKYMINVKASRVCSSLTSRWRGMNSSLSSVSTSLSSSCSSTHPFVTSPKFSTLFTEGETICPTFSEYLPSLLLRIGILLPWGDLIGFPSIPLSSFSTKLADWKPGESNGSLPSRESRDWMDAVREDACEDRVDPAREAGL